MIEKIYTIMNDNVNVSCSITMDTVMVGKKDGIRPRCFGGWGGLFELYKDFEGSFSEGTTYEDAINFFTPNIKSHVINAQ